MTQAIQEFIAGKRIAVVGVSRSGKGFGSSAYRELAERGYQVFAVNPAVQELDGQPCYPDIAALSGKIDSVVICVPAEQGAHVLRQAAELGLRNVWLQRGAESPELLALAQELRLQPITGKCILMYATPVRSVHGWHRAFVRLTGRL